MLHCIDNPDSHVFFNSFSTNHDIFVHLLRRGKIELYWRLLYQASKRFAEEEQVAFDYQDDRNGEVFFIW
jgi:hypothetical protein